MDPDLVKLIEQEIREGITAAGLLVAVICLVAAGTGAFLASYLKTKGQNLATKEDFSGLLEQLKAQTKATEDIKGEIQRKLNAFTDTLQRGREFAGFRRERLVGHLDLLGQSPRGSCATDGGVSKGTLWFSRFLARGIQ